MENATKALIIAGAILVSILLVTMGISLLSNTGALSDRNNQQVDELAIKSFNTKIESAVGEKVLGSSVAEMLDSLSIEKRQNVDLNIKVNDATDAEGIDGVKKTIKKTARYKVDIVAKDDQGYITEISVTEVKTTK